MSISGHIIGGPADPDYHGAVLTADLAVGDTVLHVDDVADFDEDAAERDAQLALGVDLDGEGEPDVATGTVALYSGCDDDASTVALSSPSTVTALSGDRIYIVDPVSGGPVGDVTVMVAIDDADTAGDALPVILDVALLSSVGEVDLTDLAVDLDEDEDGQLYVSGFPGLTRRMGRVRGYQDSHVAASSLDLSFNLTYRPLPGSTVHLWWNGVPQEDDAWSIDGWTITVDDPDGLADANDRFYVKYLYTDPTPKPLTPDPLGNLTVLGRWDLDDTSGTVAHATLGADGSILGSPALGQPGLVADGGTSIRTSQAATAQDITIPLAGLKPSDTAPAWILFSFKYGGDSDPDSTILFRDNTSAVSLGYFLDLTAANPVVGTSGGWTSSPRTITGVTSASLLDGTDHMLLIVIDGDDWAVWIDGVLVDSWTRTPTGIHFWTAVESPLHFGRNGINVTQYSSFFYDRIVIGSDAIATVTAQAAGIWTWAQTGGA